MQIDVLGYHLAKHLMDIGSNSYEYVISVNDHNVEPVFRLYGSKNTLLLNFDDVWEIDGKYYGWAGQDPCNKPDAVKNNLPHSEDIIKKVSEFFSECVDVGDTKMLIHCWAGVSRSSSIFLYLLINCHKDSLSINEIINLFFGVNKEFRPNFEIVKYLDKLFDYDGQLIKVITDRINYGK